MAELDAQTARALGVALERRLSRELGAIVHVRDVMRFQRRWDYEARERSTGKLRRRISHVRCMSQVMANVSAQLVVDVWPAVERELGARGVRDVVVSILTRNLPTSKLRRRTLGRDLAARIAECVSKGTAFPSDRDYLRAGINPMMHPVARYFSSVEVRPGPAGPARILTASDVRLVEFVPPFHVPILETIGRKGTSHGPNRGNLTLVVDIGLRSAPAAGIRTVRRNLSNGTHGFRSIYVVHRRTQSSFRVNRVH